MKYSRLLLIILLMVFISGCNQIKVDLEDSYVETLTDKVEFNVGDPIPNWDDYFTFKDESLIEDYKVNSDFDYVDEFDQEGTFEIQVKINLTSGQTVYDFFKITVGPRLIEEVTDYNEALTNLITNLEAEGYYAYESENIIRYKIANEINNVTIDKVYKQYINMENGFNFFHTLTDYDYPSSNEFDEVYITIGEEGAMVIERNDFTESEWVANQISFEELFEMIPDFGVLEQKDLMNGVENIEGSRVDGNMEFIIPLSRENFSINSVPELFDSLKAFEKTNFLDSFINLIKDNYSLINCTVITNGNVTEIIKIQYDYKDFFTVVYGDDEVVFTDAKITKNNFSKKEFSIELPEVNDSALLDTVKVGTTLINQDGTVLSSAVDTDNNALYYTIEGDNYLYKFDYVTNEKSAIYFDIMPDQLYYSNDKLYIGLSDGHKYYWPKEEQYGGLAIVDVTDFTIVKNFSLNFDPYSIVVDKYGFIYVTEGSHQHCSMFSINPISGQIIDEMWGLYYMSKIYYSPLTNRIYGVELRTTRDDLEVYKINRGMIDSSKSGEDGFSEVYISMRPDGKQLYSGSGHIFDLQTDYDWDGLVVRTIPFEFTSAAFNLVNNETYLATDYGIIVIDENNDIQEIFEYNIFSKQLVYDEGKLINIGQNNIEILHLDEEQSNKYIFVANTTVNGDFNPKEYITNMIDGMITYSKTSGSVDNSTLGQYEIKYSISEIGGQSSEGEITLVVNVIDDQKPTITLDQSTEYDVLVNSDFVAPPCSATDNYDTEVTCEVLSNGVDTSEIGEYIVTYKAIDSSGNIELHNVFFNVILPTVSYDTSSYTFTGNISDAVIDFDTNSMFYIDYNAHEVVMFNFVTEEKSSISFEYQPERLVIDGRNLYVSIIHQDHSPYWWDEEQTGEIAVINMDTFSKTGQYTVDVDPYSFVINNGFVYIIPGSGQWVNMKVYNQSDLSFAGNGCHLRERTVVDINPNNGYIFGLTQGLSPQSMERYLLNGAACISMKDDPGHGDYRYGNELFVSPNSDYVFSATGFKFYANDSSSHVEMDYAGDMKFEISAIYFDAENYRTYFGQDNGYVIISDNLEYKVIEETFIGYQVDEIYADSSTLYILSYKDSGNITLVIAEKSND